MGTAEAHLQAIFDADRAARDAEQSLLGLPPESVASTLARAVQEALAKPEASESTMQLERLSDLCAQVHGPMMVDALIAILGGESTSARIEAYEALQDVAYERYAEVARGIERALQRKETSHAMRELPFLIAEIGEPSARPLITRFLAIDDVEVQAAAGEALVELGDPAAIADLEPFVDDERELALDEDANDAEEREPGGTLGELVVDAIDALGHAEGG